MRTYRLKPREQGDIGELSAMEWLASKGAHIYVPIGHSPDVDLIATIDGHILRIEVKTSTFEGKGDRWTVTISTSGGNQSWTGLVKHFEPERCDYLFVQVGDGRRWFIPSGEIEANHAITLGGPKYSEFEVEKGHPLHQEVTPLAIQSTASPGEYRSGQTGGAVNAVALSFGGSNPPSPITSPRQVLKPTKYERRLGRSGHAVINQKRRLTIPQRAFFESGFENGSKVRVRSVGPGRILVEQTELPAWAQER